MGWEANAHGEGRVGELYIFIYIYYMYINIWVVNIYIYLYIHCVYVICVINSTESTTDKCSNVSDTLGVHCTAMQRYLPALF